MCLGTDAEGGGEVDVDVLYELRVVSEERDLEKLVIEPGAGGFESVLGLRHLGVL